MSKVEHDHLDDDPTLEEFAEWERARQTSLRCFEVRLTGGQIETVWAHMHENNNPAGHLNFITINEKGVHAIRTSYNRNAWLELREIFDPTPIAKRNIH